MRIAGAYALVAAMLAVVFTAGILGGGFRAIERSDYMTYHVAARIVLNGDGDCLYEVECQAAVQRELIGEEPSFARGALPYNSPPWLAALVAPLGLLSLQAGFVLFTVLGLAVLGWGAWRLSAWPGAAASSRVLIIALLLTAWPTVMGAIRGQVTLLVGGLLAVSVAGSGSALGLATLKPTLPPIWTLWLVFARQWRELAAGAAVLLVVVPVSAVVVSPQALSAYPAHLLGVAAPDAIGVHPEQMINWRGVAERIGGGVPLVAAGTLISLGMVAAGWWRSGSRQLAAAAAFIATPLVIPHANQHDAIVAAVGVILVIVVVPQRRAPLVVAALATHALLWTGPLLQAMSGEASAWLLFGVILGWLVIATAAAWSDAGTRYFRPVPVPARTD
jgi:hypothetical protein